MTLGELADMLKELAEAEEDVISAEAQAYARDYSPHALQVLQHVTRIRDMRRNEELKL